MSTHGGGGSRSRRGSGSATVRERKRTYTSAVTRTPAALEKRVTALDARADTLYAQARDHAAHNPEEVALAQALDHREQTRMLLGTRGVGGVRMTPALQARFEAELAAESADIQRRARALRAAGGNPDLYLRAEAARLAADRLAAEADRARGGSGAEVHLTEAARETARDILGGRDLPRSAWASMAGGVPGGYVGVIPGGSSGGGRTLKVSVAGEHMHATHRVYRMGHDVIWRTEIAESDRGSRTSAGGATIIRGLTSMRDHGITQVDATAVRGPGYNGYMTWARAGATGPIPPNVLPAARARFGSGVRNVEDVMRQPGGPAWWRQHGDTWHAVFDFSNPYTLNVISHLERVAKRHGATGGGA